MKVKAAILFQRGCTNELIENDGWYLVRTRGSHRQYKHPIKSGLVTIAGKLSEDLANGTSNSILKQAQLKTPKLDIINPDSDIIDKNNSEELN